MSGKHAFGHCNICNRHAALTRDHVPPKGSIKVQPVEIVGFVDRLERLAPGRVTVYGQDAVSPKPPGPSKSQDGVKFRTVCATCNNARLGGKYDPELNRVSGALGRLIRANADLGVALPRSIRIPIRTHFLVRGLVGHLLAAIRSPDQTQPLPGFDDGEHAYLREYFLDDEVPLTETVRVYYWLYPAHEQVIINGLGLTATVGGEYVIGHLIKFFPMAYYLAFHASATPLELSVPCIQGDGCSDLDCEVTLDVRLDSVPPVSWPETPGPRHHTIMPLAFAQFASVQPGMNDRNRQRKGGCSA